MKRLLSLFLTILFILSLGSVVVSAKEPSYSVVIPDYFESIGENQWYSEAMTINGKENKVKLSITTQEVSVTRDEIFSDESEFIQNMKESVKNIEGFTRIGWGVEEATTNLGYKYIFVSYMAMVDGEEHSFVNYIFYSENECVTFAFEASNVLFSTFAIPGFFVDDITFADGFFVDYYVIEDDLVNRDNYGETVIAYETVGLDSEKKDDDSNVLLAILAMIFLSALFYLIGYTIYRSFDHGKWGKNSNPDPKAEIADIFSKKIWLGRNNNKYLTTVKFTDGYIFTTTKTTRKNMFLWYQISISDELKQEIIQNAIASHLKALRKLRKI